MRWRALNLALEPIKNIAVLTSSFEGSDVPFKDLDPRPDPARYLPACEWAHFAIAKSTAVRQVADIARQGFDAVVNLCDGAWDEDRAGIEVVHALERLNVPFTGAGSAFYDPSREAMKMACRAAGVRFPNYVFDDVCRAVDELRFPMIVKHPHGYSSVGITRESRVTDAAALTRECARVISAFGSALIEEFIEGREFTVLVSEARTPSEPAWALAPVEFRFPEGESFKHFDLKWKEFRTMETAAVEDAELAARLASASASTFAALGGSGYGRCDLRMSPDGEIYLLEINPNCSIFYPDGLFGSADFILANDAAGHRGFLEHLLTCALRRRDAARPLTETRFDPSHGFRLFAARDIQAGEIVERYEGRRRMSAPNRAREWRPVDHSCDPNLQLAGQDLIAKVFIAKGTHLTVDYLQLSNIDWEPFDCRCGSPACRKRIP